MAIQYPLINGVRYDYSSVEIRLNAKIYVGVKDLTYGDGLAPGTVRGTSAQKLGRTRGIYDPSASFTLHRAEAEDFIADLGDGFMEVAFDIVCSYSESDRPTTTDELKGCRVTKVDRSLSSGSSDALAIKFDLDLMYILHNGVSPFKNMRR